MDIISRLPGCAGQAADAVSAKTQVKMEDAPKLLKIPNVRMSRHLNTSTTTQVPQIMVQYGRSGRPSRKGPVILWQDCHGKGNSRNFCWNTVGRRFINWECLFVNRARGLFLSVYVDEFKMAGKQKTWHRLGQFLMKYVDLEEPTSFLDRVYLGCTQRECTISNETVTKYRDICSNPGFLQELWKNCQKQKPRESWCRNDIFMVSWHERSCKEVRGKILWTGEQNNSTATQSRNSMPWRPPFQERRRSRICWRIVKSVLTNCSEMSITGSNW